MSIRDDVRAIFERDPAAANLVEVLLTYPGLHAIFLHRVAHALYSRGVPILPRLIAHFSRWMTGIEIHPGARIGRGLFIDHGMGVVIGETSEVGDWVTMYQGVTLGGTGKQKGKRHPTIRDNAMLGVGASVLGAVTIGEGAKVGAGAVVLCDVPPYATAVGVPAQTVNARSPEQSDRRIESLPDPELDMITSLQQTILEMDERIRTLERLLVAEDMDAGLQHPERPERGIRALW